MYVDYDKVLEQLTKVGTEYGLKIVFAIAILIVGRIAASIVRSLVRKAAGRAKADPTLVAFAGNIAQISVIVFAVIAAMGKLGVQTASFIAVIGAAGLAVGLAFQGSLSNFAAGFLLVIFRPFKVGDFIEAAGESGVVKDISVFTTTIMTMDNKKVIVPNAKLTADNITNYTAEPMRRVDLTVGVGYGDDLDKVKKVLTAVVKENKLVLEEPETQIAVAEMADSSVNFVVRPWTETGNYWTVYFELTEAIKKRLDKEGINIPFPQRDVHIYQESS